MIVGVLRDDPVRCLGPHQGERPEATDVAEVDVPVCADCLTSWTVTIEEVA